MLSVAANIELFYRIVKMYIYILKSVYSYNAVKLYEMHFLHKFGGQYAT